MRVSKRYASLAAAVAAAFATTAASAGDEAPTPPSPPPPHMGCCVHPGGPTINVPGVHIGGPNVHVGGTHVNIGGVNLNSSVNVNVNASASASALAQANAINNSSTVVYGGGAWIPPAARSSASAIAGLRLAEAYELIEEERTRWIEEWRVVRAVCVDDTGTPHPASRPDPEERVDPYYDGEIFRCMAGTAMQVTIGWEEHGEYLYEGGQTLVCEKGEALRHEAGGRLYCAVQEERRNCNERSLLRRYGPGIKLIYYRYEETYTETVERRSERSVSSSMNLVLDGGVGGY